MGNSYMVRKFTAISGSLTPVLVWLLPAVANGQTALNNPLARSGDFSLQDLLLEIVGILQILIMPFIVVFVIYAGFMYVTARGNPESIKTANRALTYAIIGTLIVLGAAGIGEIVENTVNSF